MKAYIVILLVAVSVASADEGQSQRRRRYLCRGNADCRPTRECCVKITSPFEGSCKPMARLNQRCLPRNMVDANHQPTCPCVANFQCVPFGTKRTELGDIPTDHRCVPGTEADSEVDPDKAETDAPDGTGVEEPEDAAL